MRIDRKHTGRRGVRGLRGLLDFKTAAAPEYGSLRFGDQVALKNSIAAKIFEFCEISRDKWNFSTRI